jgi:hypothetical protein
MIFVLSMAKQRRIIFVRPYTSRRESRMNMSPFREDPNIAVIRKPTIAKRIGAQLFATILFFVIPGTAPVPMLFRANRTFASFIAAEMLAVLLASWLWQKGFRTVPILGVLAWLLFGAWVMLLTWAWGDGP